MSWGIPPAAPPAAAPARLSQSRLLVIVGGAFAVILVNAAAIAIAGEPPPPTPPCPVGSDDCGGPPGPGSGGTTTTGTTPSLPPSGPGSTAPMLELGTAWTSTALGYRFVYDESTWRVANESATHVSLELRTADGSAAIAGVIIEGVRASDFTPRQLLEAELELQRSVAPDLVADSGDYYAIQGASIGYVDGDAEAATYKGTLTRSDGTPGSPVGYSLIAASDGALTVVVAVWSLVPDRRLNDPEWTRHFAIRQAVDDILKDFQWAP